MSGSGKDAVRPTDADATVVLPTPGRRRGAFPSYLERAAAAADLAALGGLNPLAEAANPILAAVAQIRHSLRHPDPAGLRVRLRQQIDGFERGARAAGVPPKQIEHGRFALCALLDDSAQATPWGREWSGARAFLAELHGEQAGGERFFTLLEELQRNPSANAGVLEFFYICMALGFEGRYRGGEGGRQALAQQRTRLYELLEKARPQAAAELSGRWRGAGIRMRREPGMLGFLALGAGCLLVLAALYITYSVLLGASSDPVARELARLKPIPVAGSPAPARKASEGGAPAFAKALADVIARGEVDIAETPRGSLVQLRSDGMFGPGSARLDAASQAVVLRIAQALDVTPGAIVITGHTDDVPIRTARFPSNWELSTERARSVAALMAPKMRDARRLRAEGVADSEPVVPNDSAANRARNRRVAILVLAP